MQAVDGSDESLKKEIEKGESVLLVIFCWKYAKVTTGRDFSIFPLSLMVTHSLTCFDKKIKSGLSAWSKQGVSCLHTVECMHFRKGDFFWYSTVRYWYVFKNHPPPIPIVQYRYVPTVWYLVQSRKSTIRASSYVPVDQRETDNILANISKQP